MIENAFYCGKHEIVHWSPYKENVKCQGVLRADRLYMDNWSGLTLILNSGLEHTSEYPLT